MKRVKILHIPFDALTLSQSVEKIEHVEVGARAHVYQEAIGVEAPQFGVYGFATDVSPARTPSMLLKIPQFCVTSGMQAVQRIRDLEADRWHYPIDDIGRFIDLSGQVFCDRVREDLGLPRLEEPRAAWPTPAASKVAKQAS